MSVTPEQFRRKLKQMSDALDVERARFHRDAAIIVRDERAKGFMQSVGPTGESWRPLKPATIKRKKNEHATQKVYRKKKSGPSGISTRRAKASKHPEKPLIDTMDMMTPTVESNKNEGRVVMARSRRERVSNEGSIANIHNKGTSKIPRREHWGIYREALREVTDIYGKWIVGIVKRYGNG